MVTNVKFAQRIITYLAREGWVAGEYNDWSKGEYTIEFEHPSLTNLTEVILFVGDYRKAALMAEQGEPSEIVGILFRLSGLQPKDTPVDIEESMTVALSAIVDEFKVHGIAFKEHAEDRAEFEFGGYSVRFYPPTLRSGRPVIAVVMTYTTTATLVSNFVDLEDWEEGTAREVVNNIIGIRDRSVKEKTKKVFSELCDEMERRGFYIRQLTSNFLSAHGPKPEGGQFIFTATDHTGCTPASINAEFYGVDCEGMKIEIEYENWTEHSAKEMIDELLQHRARVKSPRLEGDESERGVDSTHRTLSEWSNSSAEKLFDKLGEITAMSAGEQQGKSEPITDSLTTPPTQRSALNRIYELGTYLASIGWEIKDGDRFGLPAWDWQLLDDPRSIRVVVRDYGIAVQVKPSPAHDPIDFPWADESAAEIVERVLTHDGPRYLNSLDRLVALSEHFKSLGWAIHDSWSGRNPIWYWDEHIHRPSRRVEMINARASSAVLKIKFMGENFGKDIEKDLRWENEPVEEIVDQLLALEATP